MAVVLKPTPATAYGGRLLYTVNQKNNGNIFGMHIGQSDDTYRSVIMSFSRKQDAEVFAFALECHKQIAPTKEFPVPVFQYGDDCDMSQVISTVEAPSPLTHTDVKMNLQELYIHTWDSFHLREHILTNNMSLLICDPNHDNSLSCTGRLFTPSENLYEYIDTLDDIVSKD